MYHQTPFQAVLSKKQGGTDKASVPPRKSKIKPNSVNNSTNFIPHITSYINPINLSGKTIPPAAFQAATSLCTREAQDIDPRPPVHAGAVARRATGGLSNIRSNPTRHVINGTNDDKSIFSTFSIRPSPYCGGLFSINNLRSSHMRMLFVVFHCCLIQLFERHIIKSCAMPCRITCHPSPVFRSMRLLCVLLQKLFPVFLYMHFCLS